MGLSGIPNLSSNPLLIASSCALVMFTLIKVETPTQWPGLHPYGICTHVLTKVRCYSKAVFIPAYTNGISNLQHFLQKCNLVNGAIFGRLCRLRCRVQPFCPCPVFFRLETDCIQELNKRHIQKEIPLGAVTPCDVVHHFQPTDGGAVFSSAIFFNFATSCSKNTWVASSNSGKHREKKSV